MNNYIFAQGDFNKSLEVEKVGQPIADAFYKNHLKALDIRRYNWNDPNQKMFQKMGIDCTIELCPPSLDLFWLNISEKFRQCDTGDMCIELWSDFEKKKCGWAVSDDCVDCYLYVTPNHIFEIFKNNYFDSMINNIMKEWDWDSINVFLKENETKFNRDPEWNSCYDIKIGQDRHDAKLIKTWSKAENNKWCGICVCIPWKTLFNEYFLDISMYNNKYENLNINKEYA